MTIDKSIIYETERMLKTGLSMKGIDINKEEGIKYDLELALGMAENGDFELLVGMLKSMRKAFRGIPGIGEIVTRQIKKFKPK